MCGKKKTETEILTNEKETEALEHEKAWKHLTNAILMSKYKISII